ncbi:Crp/Fnr family transcriptional regulator [Aggregatimonas sangjinii]|uniref:Crp/Fnr family transcriptional regulator n=1 Tax=Aggregatimonas sangjinii TaxID=2583587 RepID=UPI001F39C0B6|nr:Crp/Fnr family transcriptional regulator [Aggregatimonas sangjinii]
MKKVRTGTESGLTNDSKLFANIRKHIDLDGSEKIYLEGLVAVKTYQKNELLLDQGQVCKNLFFVEEGSLRAYHLNREGKEATIMFAIEDWWISDMYCFANQKPAMVSLEALEASKVVALSFDVFGLLVQRLPKFERFFRILFQNAYAREQLRILDAISFTTEQRYHRFVSKYPHIAKKVTQKQIASYLGVTPEFLSSVKKK